MGRIHSDRSFKGLLLDFRTLFATVLTDPGSSLAYGVDALVAVTVIAFGASQRNGWMITVAAAAIIMTVYFFAVLIYNQMSSVHADHHLGGGCYVSAVRTSRFFSRRPRFKTFLERMGVIGQASLLADYPVTQAISLMAGVEALYFIPVAMRVEAAVILLIMLSVIQKFGLANLGKILIWPVLAFYAMNLGINLFGLSIIFHNGWHFPTIASYTKSVEINSSDSLSILLHAVANGATLITGVEVGYSSVNIPSQGDRSVRMSLWILYVIVFATYALQLINFLGLGIVYTDFMPVPIQIAKHLGGDGLAIPFGVLTALMLILAAQTAQSDYPLGLMRMAREEMFPKGIGDSSWKRIRTKIGDRFRTHGGVYNPRSVMILGVLSIIIIVLFPSSHRMEGMYGMAVLFAMSITVISYLIRLIRARVNFSFVFLGSAIFLAMLVNITASKFFEGAWFTVLIMVVYVLVFILSHGIYSLYRKRHNLLSIEEAVAFPAFQGLETQKDEALLVTTFHPGVILFLKKYIKKKKIPLVLHFQTQESESIPSDRPEWFRNIPVPGDTDLITAMLQYIKSANIETIHVVPLLVSGNIPFKRFFFGNAIDALRESLSRVANLQVVYNRERVPLSLREVFQEILHPED